jgi:hypothetical protein
MGRYQQAQGFLCSREGKAGLAANAPTESWARCLIVEEIWQEFWILNIGIVGLYIHRKRNISWSLIHFALQLLISSTRGINEVGEESRKDK